MSIKQIDQATLEDGKGVEKKIHAGAERLIYDVLQSTQYSTPIASTVRELTTNAWDSQREKEIAHEILTGEKSVEDYFITRDGDQYKDSNFDPAYYDLDKLDMDLEQVELRYTRNPGAGFCDLFEVIDFGVGLGRGIPLKALGPLDLERKWHYLLVSHFILYIQFTMERNSVVTAIHTRLSSPSLSSIWKREERRIHLLFLMTEQRFTMRRLVK